MILDACLQEASLGWKKNKGKTEQSKSILETSLFELGKNVLQTYAYLHSQSDSSDWVQQHDTDIFSGFITNELRILGTRTKQATTTETSIADCKMFETSP